VDELQARELPVRAVTRGPLRGLPEAVEHVTADLDDADSAARAVDGAGVVYHAANPPYDRWVESFPALNAAIAAATAAAGARLVFADNLYMYGPGAGTMTEETPLGATDKKGRLRARLAADLLAEHEAGRLQVVIGRSPDYFGAHGVNSALGGLLFGPALDGGTIRWLGSLDAAHSVSYLPDLARGLVTLGLADDTAAGRAWHLPTSGAPTGREFVAVMSDQLGRPLKASATPRWMLRLVGLLRPEVREVADIAYQWEAPFVSSDAAFQAAFGPFETTPLEAAIRETLDWYRQRGTG
jgi:nucleoside-diphosphate-sugar epimerase